MLYFLVLLAREFAFSLTKTANEIEQLRKRNTHLEARNQYLQRCLDEAEEEQQDSQAPASQEQKPSTKLPDLYAIRDKIIDDWEIKSRKESRRLLHEFADKFIKAIIASDSNYTMLQRLLSDLQQERKNVYAYGQAIANISTEYDTAKKHLRKYERGW
ncbi:hypothetical protein NIES4071_108160 (plasmid) [Calothrix sp. NIES-4071]|nr:hypothetical protein NIES4071_108160 [Calothrix sp. NIES-4071]BAZ64856.1 hypothetical protein NIES4105_105890 [Calothrix sp. NIES-4105]